MKKLLFIFLSLATVFNSFAQEKKNNKGLMSRTSDHFMVQLSNEHWVGVPDSIKNKMTGFARGANIYIMMDKRFKANPQWGAAFGVGIGSSNIFFKNMNIDIKAKANKLPFNILDSLARFKKYKLATVFLEIPIELRFTLDPANESKSFKAALGVKVGTLLNVHTKGKALLDKNGTAINSYTSKENGKGFFNSTRLAATVRVGYGNFSLFGSYQLNNIFKDGVASPIKLFQVGLTFSGL